MANLKFGRLHSWFVGTYKGTALLESNLAPCHKIAFALWFRNPRLEINPKSFVRGGPFISQSLGFFYRGKFHTLEESESSLFHAAPTEIEGPRNGYIWTWSPTRAFRHTLDSLSPWCLQETCFVLCWARKDVKLIQGRKYEETHMANTWFSIHPI